MVLTITVLAALMTIVLFAAVMSEGTIKLSQIGYVSSDMEISNETPKAVLADQLRMGNINREMYEMLVSEKLGVKLA